MSEYRTIRSLDEATDLEHDDQVLVRGDDLRRWAGEMDRLRESVAAEREACARIAEDRLGRLYHGHGASGDQLILGIIEEIRRRTPLP